MNTKGQSNISARCFTTGAMSRLSLHMKKRYKGLWINQWNNDDETRDGINQWYEGLKHLTVDDVKRGLDNLKSKEPPSIQEFVELCKKDVKKRVNRPKYELYETPEQKPLAKVSTRKSSMSKIKGFLV